MSVGGSILNLPLVNHSNHRLLENFVKKRLIEGQFAVETSSQAVVRHTAQAGAIAIGCVGSIFFAPISLKYAGDQIVLGYVLAAGNSGSFSCLSAWSWMKITSEFLTPKTPEEMEIEKGNAQLSSSDKILKSLCVIVGLAIQIPLAYVAYAYNSSSVAGAVITLGSEGGAPVYSLILSANRYLTDRSLTSFEKKMSSSKKFLTRRIHENEQALLELNEENRKPHLQRLIHLKNGGITEGTKELFLPINPSPSKESLLRMRARYVAAAVGLGLAGLRLYYFGALGTKAMSALGVPSGLDVALGSLISACSAFLTIQAMVNTAEKTYDLTINYITRNQKPSLASVLHTPLKVGLWGAAIVFASLAFAPALEITKDLFSNTTASWFGPCLYVGSFLMLMMANGDLIHDLVIEYVKKRGTETGKQIIELHFRNESLAKAIARCPIQSYAHFLKLLPDDILTECLSTAGITVAQLEAYIDEKCLSTSSAQALESDSPHLTIQTMVPLEVETVA